MGQGDRDEFDRSQAFNRRALLLGGFTTVLLGGLVSRMYQLQILEADRYKTLAEDNRINLQMLPPPRGRILDRYGIELASNAPNYRVLLVPEQTKSIPDTLDLLAQYIELPKKLRDKVIRDAKPRSGLAAVTVIDGLDWEMFSKLNLAAPNLPGLVPDVGQIRTYPYGATLSHLLGYVDDVSERDLKNTSDNDPLLRLPGFPIGKNGVERSVDRKLRGKAGLRQIEVNAHGRVIRELARQEGKAGDDIELTIDMELQNFAQERMKDESASAVMMDCRTGEILCFVSNPGYDPNEFIKGFTEQRWEEMNADPLKPLLNKALAAEYPPGSTFKLVTAMTGLDAGVIDVNTHFNCGGSIRLGSHVFHCHGAHGSIDVIGALKASCNVFFYEVGKRVGTEAIAAMAARFGLGVKIGFEVPGERPGSVPSEAWKRARFNEGLLPGDALNTAIGQGFVTATPLQLATMVARVANGGYSIQPHVVRKDAGEMVPIPDPAWIGVSADAIGLVHAGMDAVVNAAGGTAGRSRLTGEGMRMAGKTGTAQVRGANAVGGTLRGDVVPWHLRNHALFVCFAPVEQPRYAMAVVVEHGQGGAKAAAPIAKDIMTHILEKDMPAPTPVAQGPTVPT